MISILLTSLNCQNTSFKPEGYWIGMYSLIDKSTYIEDLEGDIFDDTIRLKKVLTFNNDSLILTSFNETLYYGFNEYNLKYSFTKDSIIIENKTEHFAVEYSYGNEENLVIDFDENGRVKYKDHFTKIEEYEMSHKEKEIRSFLINNSIVLAQRIGEIEFNPPSWKHMGEFIQDSLEVNSGNGNYWYFCSIDKELFLIIGDYVIHVSEFDNEKIYGYTYDRKRSKIEIEKSKD